MRTIKLTALIWALLAVVSVHAQTYVFDSAKSELKWTGKKVLGQHYGKINLSSGELTLANNRVKAGEFIIDMNSITNDDLPAGETNNMLVGHLKSDDFFGVAKYPTAKLVLRESSVLKDGKAIIKGSLTIKEKTHPIEFEGIQNGGTFTATLVVDRSKYDVRYGSSSFFQGLGDKVIYDEFTLEVKLLVKSL